MKTHRISIGIITALLAASLVTSARADLGGPSNPDAPATLLAQNGSAFTYQGQLRKSGAPVNASCNASFGLFDAASGGAQVGGTVTSPTLQVANGLFTIALDFGWNINGEARWLETAIGCGEAQTTLTPRTALQPAPYAFALPGMRTVPGSSDGGGNPTMNVIGGVVSGAISNTISADSFNSAIGGGYRNLINNGSFVSAIGGGYLNRIDNGSTWSAIGGGYSHLISGTTYSAIGGGNDNRIDNASAYSAIGGGESNRILNSSARSAIGGGRTNFIRGTTYSAIGGGMSNRIDNGSNYSAIGGGESNRIDNSSEWSAIGGGYKNLVENGSFSSAIGGGDSNLISATTLSAIGGGYDNRMDNGSNSSAIGGGIGNRIDTGSSLSAIGGGSSNVITSATWAVIPGGYSNRVEGDYGFAAGRQAKALHNGTFVWGDSTNADIASTARNQFIVRASGGVTLFTNAGASVGANLAPGSGSWTTLSDRNLKANTATVDPRAVLDAVASLPVSTWNYTAQDASIRHIGPMAQDFYAAFNVGESDTGISTVDAQGVALAAIQGLYQQNLELKARIETLQNQASPPAAFRLFDLLSIIAFAGFAIMWIRQHRTKRGQV